MQIPRGGMNQHNRHFIGHMGNLILLQKMKRNEKKKIEQMEMQPLNYKCTPQQNK